MRKANTHYPLAHLPVVRALSMRRQHEGVIETEPEVLVPDTLELVAATARVRLPSPSPSPPPSPPRSTLPADLSAWLEAVAPTPLKESTTGHLSPHRHFNRG